MITLPLASKDLIRLGWIYPKNMKLSSHTETFVHLLEQSIQRSIAYTERLHQQQADKRKKQK